MTGRDLALGKEVVEVSHEALIQRWGRLRQWIDEDREFLRTRERIAMAAAYWEKNGYDHSLMLAPGRPLAEAEELLDQRRADLDRTLIEYIDKSRNAEQARQQAEREADRQRLVLQRRGERNRQAKAARHQEAAERARAEREAAEAEAARQREAAAQERQRPRSA